jgi:small conductance mechanosensitive channel
MEQFLNQLAEYFDPKVLAEKAVIIGTNALKVAITLLVFYIIYRVLKNVFSRVITKFEFGKTIENFLLMALKYTLIIFAVVTALDQIGYNIATLIAGLGIAGIAIGFAAKDTLSNVLAGVFIFWDKPFYIGDLVEIEGEYGEVQNITLRTTRIVTPDGRMVSIPNQNIAANKIISYTMFPNLRLDMDVTIGVEEPIEPARQEMLKIIKGDERFLDEPEPVVLVQELGDFYTKIQLRVWLKDTHKHIGVRAELREKIKNAFDNAKIEMPFETIEVLNHRLDEKTN